MIKIVTHTEALYKKWSFPLRVSSVPNLQETADLVTFTEKILNGKIHFLCSEAYNTATSKPQHIPEKCK